MSTPTALNLNADLGESFGAWRMGDDAALLPLLNSANIACGFHAGDPLVMRRTVRAALAHGVGLGAHPSFPDLQGFGRRRMDIAGEELEAMLIYQIGALQAVAAAEGGRLEHVKPHGALSNMACADSRLADVVAQAIRKTDPKLILLAPALSELAAAGQRAGLAVALEIFADRAYQDDGQLRPRNLPSAVLHSQQECLEHVQAMLAAGGLVSHSGRVLPTPIHSICVHGDGPQAVASARALREGLVNWGCSLASLKQLAAPAGMSKVQAPRL